jgi:hypothetical protein
VVCWRHLPALLRSQLPIFARLELLLFLLLPMVFLPIGLTSIANWLQVLFSLFVGDWNYWNYDGEWDYWNTVSLLTWYVLGFGMAPLVVVAWQQIDRPPLWRLLCLVCGECKGLPASTAWSARMVQDEPPRAGRCGCRRGEDKAHNCRFETATAC